MGWRLVSSLINDMVGSLFYYIIAIAWLWEGGLIISCLAARVTNKCYLEHDQPHRFGEHTELGGKHRKDSHFRTFVIQKCKE